MVIEMEETCWTLTAEKLESEGFSVERECIAHERTAGLWCVKVSRDGRHWTAYAGDAGAALAVLESQTREVVERHQEAGSRN